ncbi:hypothetical protein HUJ04_010434 [Dendroctonus ponderosae]|nr:hypothetical protein HUJ04_010434 [Dendroctonus ponderosae]
MESQIEEKLEIIHDLYSLITPHIPCDQSKIKAVHYSRLRYIDYYGTTFLRLSIELVNTATGENWTLIAIAKILPKYSIAHDLSDIRTTFKNEVGIYMSARRAIDAYLKDKGIRHGEDFFANSFGGRINLNGTNEVDHNAVLVVTDLRHRGYKTVHRRTGFDLETTQAILTTLAKFHGSSLGMKLQEPKEFKDKILPYLGQFCTTACFEKVARSHMIQVLKNENFSPLIIDRAVATFDRKCCLSTQEPWSTFTHTNAWVNNIMVKYDKNNYPQDIRLKGFQESQYCSPVRDVLVFLFSSVQLVVLKEHLNELLDVYYDNFLKVLDNLNIDIKAFSRASFNQELKASASTGDFYKTVCKLYPILGTNQDIYDNQVASDLKDPLHIKRLCLIVRQFDERGCEVSQFDQVEDAVQKCDTIIFDNLFVPAGSSFNGQGELYWDGLGIWGSLKPNFFQLRLHNTVMSNIVVLNPPKHSVILQDSTNVELIAWTIDASAGAETGGVEVGQNTDGFIVKNSTYVVLQNSVVYNQGAHILVDDVICYGGHGLTLSVGLSADNVELNTLVNVTFINSILSGGKNAIHIKTHVDGGAGKIEKVVYKNIEFVGPSEYGIIIQENYKNLLANDTLPVEPKNNIPITDLQLINIVGSVASSAIPVYILCAEKGCSDWTFSQVSVVGCEVSQFGQVEDAVQKCDTIIFDHLFVPAGSSFNGQGELYWDGLGIWRSLKPNFFQLRLHNTVMSNIVVLNPPKHSVILQDSTNVELIAWTIDASAEAETGGVEVGQNTVGFIVKNSTYVVLQNSVVYNQVDCVGLCSGPSEYGIIIQENYKNLLANDTLPVEPKNNIPITDLQLINIVGSVASSAIPVYILCAEKGCSDWTFSQVSVGGSEANSCNYEPSGFFC